MFNTRRYRGKVQILYFVCLILSFITLLKSEFKITQYLNSFYITGIFLYLLKHLLKETSDIKLINFVGILSITFPLHLKQQQGTKSFSQ